MVRPCSSAHSEPQRLGGVKQEIKEPAMRNTPIKATALLLSVTTSRVRIVQRTAVNAKQPL